MDVVAKADRLERLLRELHAASRPVSARALAAMLQVTDRSIRSYVKELNDGQDDDLIRSTPSGYQLDRRVYRIRREHAARRSTRRSLDQRGRLNELARILLTASQDCEVFELADRLFVSPSTLEADLGRVRLLLRDHELTLTRHGSYVRIDGPQQRRRRLIRQILLSPGDDEPESDQHRTHLARRRELTRGVRAVLADQNSSPPSLRSPPTVTPTARGWTRRSSTLSAIVCCESTIISCCGCTTATNRWSGWPST